ncbi:hypothetical protein KC332_g9872 [Hortaea werneckii]|nr:hypothetical protein KC358_g3920 [Hortaea werneckii]OTA35837.1 hypothetical protein BTJ68_03998 [Hortaea werneckii EXF-2000]KAI6847975.1 hypothetical protein KC350_g3205 [Hortaea werneckii]KAI6940091.1 hypothetical protein KC341_g3728 [Hortaea werneckii]KAI6943935.1 hypothetical protein KC348_g4099 [Hortaea werneckii]
MARSQSARKRTIDEVENDSDSSECITVAQQPRKVAPQKAAKHVTATAGAPLTQRNALQTHNKRRRILSHVQLPKFSTKASTGSEDDDATASRMLNHTKRAEERSNKRKGEPRKPTPTSNSKRLKQSTLLGLTDSPRSVHKAQPETPQSVASNSSVRVVSGGSQNERPKRHRSSGAQISYAEIGFEEDSSEDELAQTMAYPRSRASRKRRAVEESSDYEQDSDTAAEISEDDDLSADLGDSSSTIVSEDTEPEPVRKPTKSKGKILTGSNSEVSASNKQYKASREEMRYCLNLRTSLENGLKGLAVNLPPLSDLDDVFDDMTKKALRLGLKEALGSLKNRSIRIATLCSGTESPLLAMEMVADALKAQGLAGFDVEHVFSAEIVPHKQAYIERNFAPPRIFRDITEFPEALKHDEPHATTAYGSVVPIPMDVDIVIAGTSCVDYSRQNNHQVSIDADGESGRTWRGALAYCKASRPAIVIFENIVNAAWGKMISDFKEIGYGSKGVLVDTKDFYLPHTRQRGYMVCFDGTSCNQEAEKTATRWQDLIIEFRRLASSPVSSFLIPSDQVSLRLQARDDDKDKDVDWSKCEITQLEYRQDSGIGYARPFTQWQESGTMVVPENSSAPWYHRQVERVKDTIDCLYLRKALPSQGMYDARYKTRVVDLSQNVYRAKDEQQFGIIGCITPTAQTFISDAGRAMAAEESLKLQGLPLDKISFTTETQAELQSLAGNAMSTTIIGPAILAALILGHSLVKGGPTVPRPALPDQQSQTTRPASELAEDSEDTEFTDRRPTIDIGGLSEDAERSARKCYCEGSHDLCQKPLQECIDCGHTTCTSCGGNPVHRYRQDQILTKDRYSPSVFEQNLRARMPLQLQFSNAAELTEAAKGSKMPGEYARAVEKAFEEVFSFSRVRRSHCWTVTYIAESARLDLVLSGKSIEWRMFALPRKRLACNDELRILLREPVARAMVQNTLLDARWQFRVPGADVVSASLQPSAATSPTWWARSKIPGFETHQQPDRIDIEVHQDNSRSEPRIGGSYVYLPKCGTSCDSLYMRESEPPDERPVYLFLDPTRTGDPDEDCFVFSHEKARLDYDEVRPVLARVKAPWRPYPVATKQSGKQSGQDLRIVDSSKAQITFNGHWRDMADCVLEVASTKLNTRTHKTPSRAHETCQHPQALVSCVVPKTLYSNGATAPSCNLAGNLSFLAANSWVFEAMRRQLASGCWHDLGSQELDDVCKDCAPDRPDVKWKLVETRGKNNAKIQSIVPYEDAESAARYERAIKSRPDPMIVQTQTGSNGDSLITFALNLTSLSHRAAARLPSHLKNAKTNWMVATSHDKGAKTFPKFKLRPTTGEVAYEEGLGMKSTLFPQQKSSLAWMRSQEFGRGVRFTIEEAEEAFLPVQDWRIEVRASVDLFVRGGICADHPGFGKTMTSIALVQAQLKDQSKEQIISELKERQSKAHACRGLIPSSATVIVCPGTLVQQWYDEIKEELKDTKGVITIHSHRDLSRHTISDFAAAKIVIVNRSLFSSEPYPERVAAFVGMPGPANSQGRAYAQWLSCARKQIPDHLEVLQERGVRKLKELLVETYGNAVQSDDLQAIAPSRRLRGKEYLQSQGKKGKKEQNDSKKSSSKPAASQVDLSNIDRPLFEMFYFNRLIVDEFHEYNATEYAAITALKADKRWGLSATPAIDDFYDIAQMAGFLGVPLRIGSDAKGIMKSNNIAKLRKELTDFERFDAMRSMPSSALHARIHEMDQQFLDTFVRRNVMDFSELKVEDNIVPVNLTLDHRTLYMELSQHMNSSAMRLKKRGKAHATDREERLHEAVTKSETAEEALSRSAAFCKRDPEVISQASPAIGGLTAAIHVRQHELKQLLSDLREAISKAMTDEDQSFTKWTQGRINSGGMADEILREKVNQLIREVSKEIPPKPEEPKKSKKSKAKNGPNDEDEGGAKEANDKKEKGKNALTSDVNELCKRLLVSERSLRYLKKVREIVKAEDARGSTAKLCECEGHHASVSNDIAVSAFCGHAICNDCFRHLAEQHVRQCPASGCSADMHGFHLLWRSKLGDPRRVDHKLYGAKVAEAMDILEDIERKSDQAILFVQYEEQLEQIEEALENRNLRAIVIDAKKAGEKIKDFQENPRNTVLVLNASDETAAGLNLQMANHVIFLSPLLRDSQYLYESTMAQAIGRVRRHKQKKPIYVYRLVALDTIDVDILEHREHRVDALVERGCPPIERPSSSAVLDVNDEPKKERTQLVKDKDGKFSLRPQSWLTKCGADQQTDEVDKVKGKNRVLGWEDFSSLIKFSKAYTEDDD